MIVPASTEYQAKPCATRNPRNAMTAANQVTRIATAATNTGLLANEGSTR